MKQQPDKLFKEKLASYEKKVPAKAWDKIEAGLQKEKKGVWWLKIAASLLMLMLAAYALWPDAEKDELPLAGVTIPSSENKSGQPKVDPKPQPVDSTKILQQIPAPAVTEKQPLAYTKKSTSGQGQQKQKVTATGSFEPESKVTLETRKVRDNQPEMTEGNESLTEENTIETFAVNENHPKEKDQAIKLVYSPEEVNAYLDKKALAEATPANKKSSTFKKLLKKAADLKTNQDPFGDLRQMKNEILALNFKQDKQRGQNK